jgi:hypothetical protein
MKEVHKKPGDFCEKVRNLLENILAVLDNPCMQLVRRKFIYQYL